MPGARLISSMRYTFIPILFILTCSCQNPSDSKNDIPDKIKNEISSEFFEALYSNTYYDLVDRVEADGFLQESKTGQYAGMYSRTVGAIVPLLIEAGDTERAEHLITCVFDAMKTNGLDRVPHVFDRKVYPDKPAESVRNPYKIIGRTDQVDGQAHVILAWAQLALHRGETDFENHTWHIASTLMDKSTEKPYLGLTEPGAIPTLVYNYAFEHSRLVPSNYNLLTQCFAGAALEAMITIAKRRNDNEHAARWTERINVIREGVQRHLVRNVNGKEIYRELLLKENNAHIPFDGMGWVNLSPVAAQWEPLEHTVMVNTMEAYRKGMQTWNGIHWMATDSWPEGEFYGQMIGKGIAWEIEYARNEKEWQRIQDILAMLKIIQYKHPIYMENSFLFNGTPAGIYRINRNKLKEFEQGIWKVVDPGNGEQVAWWCWAMARLRKAAGLPIVPERVHQHPLDKDSAVSNDNAHGLLFQYFRKTKTGKPFHWTDEEPLVTGIQKYISITPEQLVTDDFGVTWKGYIDIEADDDYRFFSYAVNPSRVLINDEVITPGKAIALKKGYHAIAVQYDHVLADESLEVYTQQGAEPKRTALRADQLYYAHPRDKQSIPPVITPALPEIEPGETIQVSIHSTDEQAEIYYTLDGAEPSVNSTRYSKPFTINTPTRVRAVTLKEGLAKSAVAHVNYREVPKQLLLTLQYPPHARYSSRGQRTLTDRLLGSTNNADGRWLGFEGTDFKASIDLREVKSINSIQVNFLYDQGAWIFAPKKVIFSVSMDGIKYSLVKEESFSASIDKSEKTIIKNFRADLKNISARFIRIDAQNIGGIPSWHAGVGGKAWVFVDEVRIE